MSKVQNIVDAPFEDEAAYQAFSLSFIELMNAEREKKMEPMMKKTNMQFFYHGETWSFPTKADIPAATMKEHSVELVTKFSDLVNNDLSLIEKAVRKFSEGFEVQFYKNLFGTVSEACERVGNTIDAQKYESPAQAFLEMLSKIEFMADKDGNVVMPQIHSSPDAAKRLMDSYESAPEEIKRKIEETKERKSREAIAREQDRKKRFVNYGI